MHQLLFPAALAAFVCLHAADAQAPCPARGMTVAVHGGRLGDTWSVEMTGRPLAFGILGFDLAPGPVLTPIGTVCLGLTPNLVTLGFTFDAAGVAAINRLMPVNPSLAGFTVDMAGVAIDPAQPGGFALSNGAALVAHQPRLYFVSPGFSSPFGSTPGSLAALNMVTDDVAFSQPLTTNVRDVAFVRERGWLVLLLGNGALQGFDGITGAMVLNATLTGTAAAASKLVALPGGDQLLLMSSGTPPTPFGGGTPGAVHFVSLPGGALTTSIPLASGNPSAVLLAPGTSLAFLRLQDGLVPVDWAAPVVYGSIPLPTGFGGLVDWQCANNVVYVLHGGTTGGIFGGSGSPGALSAVDVATFNVLFTNQLASPPPLQLLRAGPGTTGPSLFVYGDTAAAIDEFAQFTGTPTVSIGVGAGITAMELSALGSQWLLLCNGAGCGGPALQGLIAGTTLILPLAPLPSGLQPLIAVSPSAGFGKACLAIGTNTAAPFLTDLGTASPGSVTLPISAGLFIVVSD